MGLDPRAALEGSAYLALETYAVYVAGDLLAIWGYRPESFMGSTCNIWLLSAPKVDEHAFLFARSSARIVGDLLKTWDTLRVIVHGDYKKAVRWLTWLGFHKDARLVANNGSVFYAMRLKKGEARRWVS